MFSIVVGPEGPAGEAGVCEVACKPQSQVNFMAGLSTNCQKRGEAIPFDTVLTNENDEGEGAYDADTGSFTAPVSGTYVFHVHVLLRNLNKEKFIIISLTKNIYYKLYKNFI